MNVDDIRALCKKLPAVTEDIKWGNDLCFCVAKKMFCVVGLSVPLIVSFKVKEDEFEELINSDGIISAPYVGRYKWVLVENVKRLSRKEWEHYIKQSYELVKTKLPKTVLKKYGISTN